MILRKALTLVGTLFCLGAQAGDAPSLPDPRIDAAPTKSAREETTVFAGGCFWGVQAVFQHVKGVKEATSGYSGGAAGRAVYTEVSRGNTGHAEAVRVVFDPSKVSYGQLLKIFFSVVHDPTQLNRQGPDTGPQYRSAIFYTSGDQHEIAAAYVAQLQRAKAFPRALVTEITPLAAFYPAEAYHQDYVARHPDDPYVAFNDLPKLAQLKAAFPALYRTAAAE